MSIARGLFAGTCWLALALGLARPEWARALVSYGYYADLSLALSAPAAVVPGTVLTVNAGIHNLGPDDALQAYVDFKRPPAGLQWLGAVGCTLPTPRVGRCLLDEALMVGAPQRIQRIGWVDPGARGLLEVAAESGSELTDRTPGDAVDVRLIELVPAHELGVALASAAPVPGPDGHWHWQVRVDNDGPSAVDAVGLAMLARPSQVPLVRCVAEGNARCPQPDGNAGRLDPASRWVLDIALAPPAPDFGATGFNLAVASNDGVDGGLRPNQIHVEYRDDILRDGFE